MKIFDGMAGFGLSHGSQSTDVMYRCQPIYQTAAEYDPVVCFEYGNTLITAFLQTQNSFLPIVGQEKFLEHRCLYYKCMNPQYAFSPSLEYTMFAMVVDVDDPKLACALATKARVLLDMEIQGSLVTLGSIQASVLLGWKEFEESAARSGDSPFLKSNFER
jgi:hypothetical protein